MEFKFNPKLDVTVDGIRYKVINTEEDLQKAMEVYFESFLKGKTNSEQKGDIISISINFLDEPMTISKGGHKGQRPAGMIKHARDMILEGVSLLAEDVSNGKAVGIRLSSIIERRLGIESQ